MVKKQTKNENSSKLLARAAEVWNERALGFITEMNLQIERSALDGVQLRMPYNPEFCVDEEGTMLHGGILTALLDSAFGLANFLAVEDLESMATIDLRVEYLDPAQSRADILVFTECYRQTQHVAFNSGRIWFDTNGQPEVARAMGTFSVTRGTNSLLDKLNTMGPGQ
jgi:uncharacterized protein (TIGR00369 family)